LLSSSLSRDGNKLGSDDSITQLHLHQIEWSDGLDASTALTKRGFTRHYQLELSVARLESTVDTVFTGKSTLILNLTVGG